MFTCGAHEREAPGSSEGFSQARVAPVPQRDGKGRQAVETTEHAGQQNRTDKCEYRSRLTDEETKVQRSFGKCPRSLLWQDHRVGAEAGI